MARRPATSPKTGSKVFSRIPLLPPLGSTSSILRPPGPLPPLTGATCTSGPEAHTLPPGTSAAQEPLRPPYRHKTEVGREPNRNSNNWFRKPASHPRNQGRCHLPEKAFSDGRVSIISNVNRYFTTVRSICLRRAEEVTYNSGVLCSVTLQEVPPRGVALGDGWRQGPPLSQRIGLYLVAAEWPYTLSSQATLQSPRSSIGCGSSNCAARGSEDV
ncbi:uncharacterized protein LOC117201205 [Orcinus orca]|uniref:uncharacterized protein LOC117201205 n=1 Tax=Orcinus orca TaxID=9733 RepID=UPI002112CC4A|nr:uncharacterized protein LOC117201205 [Orcinus orca]